MTEAGGQRVIGGWQGFGVPAAAARRIDWRHEVGIAILAAAFSTLLGGAVGPLWHHFAPALNLVSANDGSAAATKALIGDDLWLGLFGILAGVVCTAFVVATSPRAARGPGAALGLALGGVLGSYVAAHLGHRIGHDDMLAALRRTFPQARMSGINAFLGYYDFKVRAVGVLYAWPIAALACTGLTTLAHAIRFPDRDDVG